MSQIKSEIKQPDPKDDKTYCVSSEDGDHSTLGMEEIITVQYRLPDSYCFESAIFFDKNTIERPSLHKMVKEWHTDILQKRMTKKKKNEEAIALTRTRNESQCSVDSFTVSGESQELTVDSGQDASEDSQDLLADSFELELEKTPEDVIPMDEVPLQSGNMSSSSPANVSDSHVSSSSTVLDPRSTTASLHQNSDSSLSFLAKSQLKISVPRLTILSSSQSTNSFSGLSYSTQSNFGLGGTTVITTPLGVLHQEDPAHRVSSSTSDPEQDRPSLSSLAASSLPTTGIKNAGPSLSSLAASSLPTTGIKNAGPSLSSLAASSLPTTGIKNAGSSLSSLAAAHTMDVESSSSSLPTTGIKNAGPSLSSLAAAHTMDVESSSFSLPTTGIKNAGPVCHLLHLFLYQQQELKMLDPVCHLLQQHTLWMLSPVHFLYQQQELKMLDPVCHLLQQHTLWMLCPVHHSYLQQELKTLDPVYS
ncbi:chitinase-like protein PB1E7.04c [Homarus americanus]|uniref:chitinase-like protein PB1E7.04c n=1 Tax=Homarus americanus TaxID=6706 RepID=UPI001C45DE23|nr:chitinase-like protein PB1E7.04c [Homarus americanus]